MQILDKINSMVWGSFLILLLLITGLLYTVRLRCIQLKLFGFLFKRKENSNSGISQFRTVCMSLGTAMGTGNITGVSAALALGGAGAVFWMWISAFLGMALVYAENYLSVLYSGKNCRGTMAYLEKGTGSKKLACVFAFMCILAAFGMGGMVQVNAFSESLRECIAIPPIILTAAVFLLIFTIVSGGAQRISSAAQLLLPAAAFFYACACIAVLIRSHRNIPFAFHEIFSQAFGLRQTVGGFSGYALSRAVSTGMRRGIFSNEAGLGSSPILHSAAESDSSHTQGMWSMFEVFFDTIVCCTLTAVTLLSSTEDFSVMTAFSSILGKGAVYFISSEIIVFAFCTVIGWYYCGESAYLYLFGKRGKKYFPAAFAALASLGAAFPMEAVWTLSDIFNGLMAFPNLFGLLMLRKNVKDE